MIELKNDSMVFTFPEVHPDAKLTIDFQRTLRIPDDGKDYPLRPPLNERERPLISNQEKSEITKGTGSIVSCSNYC